MRRSSITAVKSVIAITILALYSGRAIAQGSLTPPGTPSATMKTKEG